MLVGWSTCVVYDEYREHQIGPCPIVPFPLKLWYMAHRLDAFAVACGLAMAQLDSPLGDMDIW